MELGGCLNETYILLHCTRVCTCTVYTALFLKIYALQNVINIIVHCLEAKSATIRRMQSNLEEWNKQLQDICETKTKTGKVATPKHSYRL